MRKLRVSFTKRRPRAKKIEMQPPDLTSAIAGDSHDPTLPTPGAAVQVKSKKKAGSRLWMGFNRWGRSELIECDKSAIIKRVSIPARDLRILGPVFSHSSNILARERAMVINLEFIKAIVTAEEVLILDPLCHEVLPFVDQLRQQLPQRSPYEVHDTDKSMQERDCLHGDLPFEFQVLEIALEVVCSYLDSCIANLERDAYPVLDELTRNVSNKNLELVRSLKSNLTHLLARVQKARDEIEHLLDDNEDMAQFYLTRKLQSQRADALLMAGTSNIDIHTALETSDPSSCIGSCTDEDDDVEELEMLLEAYFMQLDGTRNRILSLC